MNPRFLRIAIVVCIAALLWMFIFPLGQSYKSVVGDTELSSMRKDFNQRITFDFEFVNQYYEIVNENTFSNKIYIADFFFTSCPTICPLMGGNKIRIQNAFQQNKDVLLLSHSIDTKTDSVQRLLEYANAIGAIRDKWHLVTGSQDAIYDIAKEYYVTAQESNIAGGSFVHDGSFILVDKNRRIRGIYDGTNSSDTELLIADVKILLSE